MQGFWLGSGLNFVDFFNCLYFEIIAFTQFLDKSSCAQEAQHNSSEVHNTEDDRKNENPSITEVFIKNTFLLSSKIKTTGSSHVVLTDHNRAALVKVKTLS